MYNIKESAFSLVELSIVLVILGLLTGGVLTGKSLIKAAELRSITTEFKEYKTAINTFELKYKELPGDMQKAENLWGTMSSGTCPNATGGTGTQTCNGNGNSIVESTASAASRTAESYLFWQHLSNAGMIEGAYTGIAGSLGSEFDDDIIGVNVPSSGYSQGGWNIDSRYIATSKAYFTDRVMEFGADNNTATTADSDGEILTPEDAWGIDKKIDDGNPIDGLVQEKETVSGCNAGSSYNLSDTTVQCALVFIKSF